MIQLINNLKRGVNESTVLHHRWAWEVFGLSIAYGIFISICVPAADAIPARLKIGIVQMALAPSVSENRDRIIAGISNAAVRGVRVVVFPEGALRGQDGNEQDRVDEAINVIKRTARESKVYVLLGGSTYSPGLKKEANWMVVLGPDGRERFRYEKLYDNHRATMPGGFDIDGIPCSAIICADRWLRGVAEIPIQQGAQISFELSCNFASEWVGLQVWANLASYLTFSATVNVVGLHPA